MTEKDRRLEDALEKLLGGDELSRKLEDSGIERVNPAEAPNVYLTENDKHILGSAIALTLLITMTELARVLDPAKLLKQGIPEELVLAYSTGVAFLGSKEPGRMSPDADAFIANLRRLAGVSEYLTRGIGKS